MASNSESRPNFLVVVFDCLRAFDFPGGVDPVPGMKFAEKLLAESIAFPRMVSPAPWTIPSHASLFTGLYPWENQVHAYGSLMTKPDVPRLAGLLKSEGYSSLSLAANPFVSPRFGLVDGFDEACWGGWWEAFLRTPRTRAPNSLETAAVSAGTKSDRLMEWVRDGPLGNALRSASQHSYRYPFALDGGSRVIQKLRFPDQPRNYSQTPWIESELDRWLAAQPSDRPVFCFLNITDTHEPYYPDPDYTHGLRAWWKLAKIRQDHACAVSGEWDPTPDQCRGLLELYRQTVRHLDLRMQQVVDIFERHGRWENTLSVFTSDHGQSLGEHGMMFHLLRLDEPLIRIPLWLRLPGGRAGGRVARGWGSLIDISPTLLDAAQVRHVTFPSARPLTSLVDRDRGAPVFSMADGIVWPHIRRRFAPDRERLWDRPFVAAYEGDHKVVLAADGTESHDYDLASDPGEAHDLWNAERPPFPDLEARAREVGQRLVSRAGPDVDSTVEDRLRAWGYI